MAGAVHRPAFRARPAFAVCLGALVAAGCGGSSGSSTRTTTAGRESVDTLEGRPQAGTLRLASGRSSARYTITALSPPTHTYEVDLVTAAAADVSVRIQTWYGQSLGVLDSTRREPHGCKVTDGRTACRLLFPGLEAQRAGPWTVIASKQLGAPATVHVSVTFAAIAPRRRAAGR